MRSQLKNKEKQSLEAGDNGEKEMGAADDCGPSADEHKLTIMRHRRVRDSANFVRNDAADSLQATYQLNVHEVSIETPICRMTGEKMKIRMTIVRSFERD